MEDNRIGNSIASFDMSRTGSDHVTGRSEGDSLNSTLNVLIIISYTLGFIPKGAC
ncbi:MAG: hypothetical protein GWN14_15635 [candidate division Zixibacteria bacterium]|nr:hypothetical protein [candidate division Zixibacteria bacterium]NIW40200.1 hypothetical protein [candidate division Zixibacteria bacterium]NIX57314.1 hypothetical protein [candidate division Zixibacteria bacterium]